MKSIRIVALGGALLLVAACGGGTEAGTPSAATTTSSTSSSSSPSSSSSSPSSSSTSKSTTSSSPSSETSETSETSSASDTGIDPVAAELVTKMIAGYATTTSVTGKMYIEGGGMSGDTPLATFGQLTDNGSVTAMQMQMSIPPAGDIELLIVDQRFFVGGDLATQYGNKYVEVSDQTTDATLKGLYTTLADTANSASVSQYVTFLQLATGTEDLGPDPVDGVDAEKYSMTLDLTRLDASDVDASMKSSMEELTKLGVTELPCTFWIDGDGRLLQAQQEVAVSGQSIQTLVTFSDYNAPLDISAPDPSLVVVAP